MRSDLDGRLNPMGGRVRYAGLAGTALMAVAGYLAGALPGTDPAVALRHGEPRALAGLAVWLAGIALLGTAWWRGWQGWRAGYVSGTRTGTATGTGTGALRGMLVTGALWAVPLLVAPPLGSRDIYAYACQGAVYLDGHDPYTTSVAAGGCPWLSTVPALWHDTWAPYGPLAIIVSAAAVAAARAVPVAVDTQLLVAVGLLRAVAVAGIVLLTWYGVRLAGRLTGPGRPLRESAVWLGALGPVVLLHAISGAHNDALLAGLLVAGLATAATRARQGGDAGEASGRLIATRHGLAAGALLGLAVAVKVTAIVALPFAVLLIAGGAWRTVLRAAAGMVGAAAVAFAGLSLLTGLDLGWLGALRQTGELVQWTSIPTGVGMAAGYLLRAAGRPGAFEEAVAVARALGLAVLAGVLIALWLRARRRAAASPRLVVADCGAALAAVAVLSPVFYPWYAIAPLAVVAIAADDERVRRALLVLGIAVSVLVLPPGLGLAVLTKLPGAILDVLLVALLVVVLLRGGGRLPRREDGAGDPAGRSAGSRGTAW